MKHIIAAFLALALFAIPAWADPPMVQPKKPTFTISKETTFLTAPLDKDGYVDYVTAANERLGKGVTPENNANVLFWKAMGPRPQSSRMSPEFFKWLGIPEPPEEGDYFIGLPRFVKERYQQKAPREQNELCDQVYELINRPWTARQYPHLAEWLKANEKALSLFIAGTKRSRYFMPMTISTRASRGTLIATLQPSVQKCREFMVALLVRAMLHLGEDRPEKAWQDLLACHRMARHVGSGATLIESLIGIAMEAVTTFADLVFLERSGLSSERLQGCLNGFERLPPLPAIAEKIDGYERWALLDIVTLFERIGAKAFAPLGELAPIPLNTDVLIGISCNWDTVLRDANGIYDRLAEALRTKNRADREIRLTAWERELQTVKDYHKKFTGPGAIQVPADNESRTRFVSSCMILSFVPAIRKVQQASDRAEQNQQNLRLAFALAAYKSEEKKYPAKLEALVPNYLPQVPRDLFSGKDLIYRPTDVGYLLYSVGANGQDDGGQTFDDDPPGDDLPIRMPRPKK